MKNHRQDWWWEQPALEEYLQSLVDGEMAFYARIPSAKLGQERLNRFGEHFRAHVRSNVNRVFNSRIRHCGFYYELFRRTHEGAKTQAPWHRLTSTQRQHIVLSNLFQKHEYPKLNPSDSLFVHSELLPAVTGKFTVSNTTTPGWSFPNVISVKLDAPMHLLIENFKSFIEMRRFRAGLFEPPKNKGKNHKDPTWSFLEVFDEDIIDESRRTRKSKARKLAKKILTKEVVKAFLHLDRTKFSAKQQARLSEPLILFQVMRDFFETPLPASDLRIEADCE